MGYMKGNISIKKTNTPAFSGGAWGNVESAAILTLPWLNFSLVIERDAVSTS